MDGQPAGEVPNPGPKAEECVSNPCASPHSSLRPVNAPSTAKWWWASLLGPPLLVMGVLGAGLAVIWIAHCSYKGSLVHPTDSGAGKLSPGITFLLMLAMNLGVIIGLIGISCSLNFPVQRRP